MGSIGSGGWNRSGRPTTDDMPRLDVNYLNKAGILKPGRDSAVSWGTSGHHAEYLHIRADEGSIVLDYPLHTMDGQWHDRCERIKLSWEACRFGGRRPSCGRRALYLYGLRQYLCRTCQGLSYTSQRESESDRAQRKANRIRRCLGGKPGWLKIPARPKGMHRKTYNRLISEVLIADAVTTNAATYIIVRSPNHYEDLAA